MLDQTALEQFEADGFLVVEGVLDLARDVQPILDEYAALLDRLASKWYLEGKIGSRYSELPFLKRLSHVARDLADHGESFHPYLDISLQLEDGKLREDAPIHLGPAVFGLLTSSRLLDVVESIIGSEITCHPTQHVRMKLPEEFVEGITHNGQMNSMVGATEWHQDQGVFLPEADESNVLTAWVPMTGATVANGCLMVVPRSQEDGLATHCPQAGNLYVPDQFIPFERIIPVPVKLGDVLLLNNQTLHASLSNKSDDVRWSFDLRYVPTGNPTGRPSEFPSFVARSRQEPETELRDADAWAAMWLETRAWLAGVVEVPQLTRWSADAPVCL